MSVHVKVSRTIIQSSWLRFMLIPRVVFFCIVFFLPLVCLSAELPVFPKSIGGAYELPQAAEVKTWSPDTMFEHVNGEAELLKRYGVVSLAFTYYENTKGDYLSVELLDMGKPINAYGLYRLYADCEEGEYQMAGATVLGGDYTSYAMLGSHFLRINAELSDAENGRALVDNFVKQFAEKLPSDAPEKSMSFLGYLQEKARKPCEVHYHPENLDYDLEAGPGYTWVGHDGQNYFLNILPTDSAAQQHGDMLGKKGVTTLLASGKTVIWQKEKGLSLGEYHREIVKEIGNRLR